MSRSPLEAAQALAPAIAERADEIEHERRLPADLAHALADAGLFRMLVPHSLGGLEVEPTAMVDAISEIARADGSAGWCVAIGATSGVMAAYLPESAAREIYGDPGAITGGVFHPRGRAVVEGRGYRVSGRWPFASGCENCSWLMGGCIVLEDAGSGATRARKRASGAPDARLVLFPAEEAQIIDTWSVAGLRGTGSHDIALDGVFVPGERAAWLADGPVHPGPLYAFPVFGLLALGIAAVGLGIARAAIDDLLELAHDKVPTGGKRALAERPATQSQIARAEALVRSARALIDDTVGDAWQRTQQGEPFGLRTRAWLRIAATDAVRRSAEAVDLVHETAGGTAVYDASPLSRRFRDIHVATQHAMVAPPIYELAGRVLLGVDTDTDLL